MLVYVYILQLFFINNFERIIRFLLINGKIRKNKDYHRPVKLLKYTIEYIVAPGAYILAIRRSAIGNAKQKGFTYIAKTTITYSNIYICMYVYVYYTYRYKR